MNSHFNDKFREEMQKHNFVQNLVSDYSTKSAFKTSMNDSLQEMMLNLIPITRKTVPKEIELEEKIKKLKENIELTEEKITQSQASRKLLTERVYALEKAIYLTKILATEHPSEEAVNEFSKLIKNYNLRIQNLKDLEQKKKIQEEYDIIDQMLISEFSLRSDRTTL